MSRTKYLLVGTAALVLLAAPLSTRSVTGQAADCLASDEVTLVYAVALATGTDAGTIADRARYGLLEVPASEVEYISDNSTCKTAGREYKKATGLQGKAPAVLVIRIGTRYLVSSPVTATDASEFVIHVIMDENLKELSSFAG